MTAWLPPCKEAYETVNIHKFSLKTILSKFKIILLVLVPDYKGDDNTV